MHRKYSIHYPLPLHSNIWANHPKLLGRLDISNTKALLLLSPSGQPPKGWIWNVLAKNGINYRPQLFSNWLAGVQQLLCDLKRRTFTLSNLPRDFPTFQNDTFDKPHPRKHQKKQDLCREPEPSDLSSVNSIFWCQISIRNPRLRKGPLKIVLCPLLCCCKAKLPFLVSFF